MIHTEKIGNNYNRSVDRKRKTYYADQVDDKAILKILTTIRGAVEPPRQQKTENEQENTQPKQAVQKQAAATNDTDLF